ncbi:MAG TPA: SagB/ThcOx family dehydrogenase [Burkholderiaceae bacterium]|nr:SagB/ThcOx family dehydrogenase [Burkholderiaceae bacterium]
MNQAHETQAALQLIAPSSLELDADITPLSMSLMEVLRQRKSSREFSPRPLSIYKLSRLLWCAFGINREEGGHRTAPSAKDAQEIDIYVALASGLYRFDPHQLLLLPVLADDIRADTGWQDFVGSAPVNLIYVANLERMSAASRVEQKFYAALDTGFISQNVYLFCAAEGLATVTRGWVDRPALAKRMGLGAGQRIVLAQTVGYPRE